jgi:cell fate regulator YaaT (PSP1 superfamily)
MPKVGSTVTTADNKKGVVTAINQLKETVRVKAEEGERIEIFDVALSDITSVRGKGAPEKEEKLPDDIKKLED